MTITINKYEKLDNIRIEQYNKKKHLHLIEEFNCRSEVFKKLLKELPSHSCCALVLIKNERILAYCAYRCSSIKIVNEVAPAIEIRAFAKDKNHCPTATINDKTIARIFFEIVLDNLNHIATDIIGAKYICLHSIDTPKLVKMYNNIGFQTINNVEELYDEFNEKCIPMFMSIKK